MFILAAARVERPADVMRLRAELRSLCAPRQRRLHFRSESDIRRRRILSLLGTHPVQTSLYLCRPRGRATHARGRTVEALVDDLLTKPKTRVVFESRAERDRDDRRIIYERLAASGGELESYEFMRAYEEPGLWVADAVAWAYGAGKDWRRRAEPLIEKTVDVAF